MKKTKEEPGETIEELFKMILLKATEKKKEVYPEIKGYQIIKILKKLRQSRFGNFYLAKDEKSGKEVVLKTASTNTKKTYFIDRKVFEIEVDNLKSLNHPNIVNMIHYGKNKDIYYFTMEYVGCGSVWDIIKKEGTFSLNMVIPVIIESLKGLAYIHEKGIVHLNLNPANILLSGKKDNLTVKITGFEMSRNLLKPEMRIPPEYFIEDLEPHVHPSPPYTAPEHIINYRYVKSPTDVFEIAATFYHMLTGKFVWDISGAEDPYKVILKGEIKPVRDINPDIPEKVAEVIDKSLSRDENYRYKDGGEMLEVMRRALQAG